MEQIRFLLRYRSATRALRCAAWARKIGSHEDTGRRRPEVNAQRGVRDTPGVSFYFLRNAGVSGGPSPYNTSPSWGGQRAERAGEVRGRTQAPPASLRAACLPVTGRCLGAGDNPHHPINFLKVPWVFTPRSPAAPYPAPGQSRSAPRLQRAARPAIAARRLRPSGSRC
jgi:hypothetical protein